MDIDTIQKTRPTPPRGCYRCEEPNHLVKNCPHRLDVQRLTAEQWEELIEDLMALKDAIAEEKVGNTLDACRTSIVPPIEIGTTDTSEVHSVKALLDSGATGNFIDKDFVHMKGISTQSISRPIPVFNVDGSPNEAEQISEVVDVILHYKTHSERTLLAVSNLGKQSMILSYTWLKDHNPEVNWQTGEVQMNRCPPRCEGCHTMRKERASQRKMEAKAINICRSGPPPEYAEDLEEDEIPLWICEVEYEQGDRLFMTRLLPEPAAEDLRATSTIFQKPQLY